MVKETGFFFEDMKIEMSDKEDKNPANEHQGPSGWWIGAPHSGKGMKKNINNSNAQQQGHAFQFSSFLETKENQEEQGTVKQQAVALVQEISQEHLQTQQPRHGPVILFRENTRRSEGTVQGFAVNNQEGKNQDGKYGKLEEVFDFFFIKAKGFKRFEQVVKYSQCQYKQGGDILDMKLGYQRQAQTRHQDILFFRERE